MAKTAAKTAAKESWDGVPAATTRVLLECGSESSPTIVAEVIARHGYEVRVCEGPDDRHHCSLLEGEGCELVNETDVVVNFLKGPAGDAAQVLPAVAAERRPPVMVTDRRIEEVEQTGGSTPADVLRDRIVEIHGPLTTEGLLEAIEEALERRSRGVPVWGDGFC